MLQTLRRAFGPAVLFVLAGCATAPRIESTGGAIELSRTPFFAQTEHHCGPAALATLLSAQGLDATPDALTPWIYVPGRQGSLQAEMIAAARRYDLLPLRLDPAPEALLGALGAEQPVLLLQNLGFRRWPAWHYAVLIGFDPATQELLLRSGTESREKTGVRRFLQTWDRADRWALVTVAPDTVPVYARLEHWLAAAAPFESLGRVDVAERAYRAALRRWPDSALAWQGLANTRYAQGDKGAAEGALRRAVEFDPASVPARNNLASVLLERGCAVSARAQLDAIADVPAAFRTAVADTRRSIEAAPAVDAPGCSTDDLQPIGAP